MTTIVPLKATDTLDEARAKGNAVISRVNELDNTAADIAGFAASAHAAARNASRFRDEARDTASTIQGSVDEALDARDQAVANRVLSETARGQAEAAGGAAVAAQGVVAGHADVASQAEADALEHRDAAALSASAAQDAAGDAIDARDAALDAADRAEAAENSLIEWQGEWAAAVDYHPGDLVRSSGSTYVCLAAHTSITFSSDMASGRWELFAQQGAPGPGTGDMTAAVYDPTGLAVSPFEWGNMQGAMPLAKLASPVASGPRIVGRIGNTGPYTDITLSATATADTVALRDASGRLAVATPTADQHAATKAYVDASVPGWDELSGKPSDFPPEAHDHVMADITDAGPLATLMPTGTPGATTALFGDGAYKEALLKSGASGIGGFNGDLVNWGNLSGSTRKPDITVSNFFRGTNNGAWTLAAPDVMQTGYKIMVTNAATGAGGLTATGFSKITGQFKATANLKQKLSIDAIDGVVTLAIEDAS